ncbi:hypothetical protein HA38_04980 [Pantoea allii]|nr:hypothetical protein HA38_04980 [Pantoea allii]PBK01647.1 hypothetical protein CMR03_04135 [Pantoea allii]
MKVPLRRQRTRLTANTSSACSTCFLPRAESSPPSVHAQGHLLCHRLPCCGGLKAAVSAATVQPRNDIMNKFH